MTREGAIQRIERERDFSRKMEKSWAKVDWKNRPEHLADPRALSENHRMYAEALDMAISALREQEEQKATLIQQYIKVPEKPQWISVEERLPERNAKVLCYMDFSKNEETKHWENSIVDNVYNGVLVGSRPTKHVWAWQGDCVTYWMPLPEPPKEEV